MHEKYVLQIIKTPFIVIRMSFVMHLKLLGSLNAHENITTLVCLAPYQAQLLSSRISYFTITYDIISSVVSPTQLARRLEKFFYHVQNQSAACLSANVPGLTDHVYIFGKSTKCVNYHPFFSGLRSISWETKTFQYRLTPYSDLRFINGTKNTSTG